MNPRLVWLGRTFKGRPAQAPCSQQGSCSSEPRDGAAATSTTPPSCSGALEAEGKEIKMHNSLSHPERAAGEGGVGRELSRGTQSGAFPASRTQEGAAAECKHKSQPWALASSAGSDLQPPKSES